MKKKSNRLPWMLGVLLILVGCEETLVPKPKGYPRIDLPQKSYTSYSSVCPIDTEIPVYAKVELFPESETNCRFNLSYPRQKARIHFTYFQLDNDLHHYVDDAHKFVFKHELKANAINKTPVVIDSTKVSGLIYDLKGQVASQLQFYLTDSTDHFLRGALYFRARPNPDSLAPVLDFIRKDVLHMINHTRWRYE